jgi:hypothetical protein
MRKAPVKARRYGVGMESQWWYIAECQVCTPRLKMPFSDGGERTDWMVGHKTATGHEIASWAEPR